MTPWVTRLLVANVGLYVLQVAFSPVLTRELMLVPALVLERPWTAVTYMFLHGGVWHLAFNMIALFFFGPRLEMRLGSRHFLGLYFVSGLVAAGASAVFTPTAAVVGASGAIFGILLAFARYWPREQLLIWGIFPIEARWLVVLLTGASLYFGVSGAQAGVAHFAHLGGFAGGYAYLRFAGRWSRSETRGLGTKVKEALGGGDRPGRDDVRRWERIDADDLHEVNREHLEELREKIRREGPESLNRRERDFLDRLADRSRL